MQINYTQFRLNPKAPMSPLYLLTGDVPLLAQEGIETIKAAAKANQVSAFESIDTSMGFDWASLGGIAATQSLFSDQKVVVLHHNQSKFDTKAQKALLAYLKAPNPDVVLILNCGKLTPAQKKTKWFRTLDETATVITIWPVSARDLPRWIQQRLHEKGIKASHDSIQLLSHYTEGNLLATQQAIEKLTLLGAQGNIDCDDMAKVISHNARFNVFDFSSYALQGNTAKIKQSLKQLKDSGAEPILILWALCRDLRDVQQVLFYQAQGKSAQPFLNKQWKTRQAQLQQAAARCQLETLHQLLHLAHQCDKAIKGLDSANVFQLLETMALGLCGLPLPNLTIR